MQKFFLWGALCCALCSGAFAAGKESDFLAAREAFQLGDARRFDLYAKRLNDYVLEPYVAYWRLRLRLDDAGPEEVRGFLARYRDTLVADRLGTEWLKVLGKKQQWPLFAEEYAQQSEVGNDVELVCYALQLRLDRGDETALSAAKPLWFNGRDMPESCSPLFEKLASKKLLDTQEVWDRLRLAFEAGNVSVATHIAARFLPRSQVPDSRKLDLAVDNPRRYLDRKSYNLAIRADREITMLAITRLARNEPQQAAQEFRKLQQKFSPAERGYMWGLLAFHGAREHDPEALAWFDLAGPLTDQMLAWKARAALREKNWPAVLSAIEALSPQEAQEPNWRYWKARALKAQGRIVDGNAILVPLADGFNFYGQLAADELGAVIERPTAAYKPGRDEIRAIELLPGIQRAMEFYRLGLRYEGNLEWQRAVRGLSDTQLLAAAELARRNELYDRAIGTADKTVRLHDFSLRYLAPYREVVHDVTRDLQLDEAWVYGLMRQESRFISSARSGVGAIGLMQLMPSTAKWVAKRLGLHGFRSSLADELNINIKLGSYYLKHVLDTLDNQALLASAAYNAGPRRAREWRSDFAMEGAVYAETIPYTETRDYVKKVMSNATYYAAQFGQQWQSLKQRLGIVSSRGKDQDLPEDEP